MLGRIAFEVFVDVSRFTIWNVVSTSSWFSCDEMIQVWPVSGSVSMPYGFVTQHFVNEDRNNLVRRDVGWVLHFPLLLSFSQNDLTGVRDMLRH